MRLSPIAQGNPGLLASFESNAAVCAPARQGSSRATSPLLGPRQAYGAFLAEPECARASSSDIYETSFCHDLFSESPDEPKLRSNCQAYLNLHEVQAIPSVLGRAPLGQGGRPRRIVSTRPTSMPATPRVTDTSEACSAEQRLIAQRPCTPRPQIIFSRSRWSIPVSAE